uniref:Uncharacterized protein n=1 Tax=Anguilla anguilla TaxID=7936 RepID=A0A0E9T591_ANGAN
MRVYELCNHGDGDLQCLLVLCSIQSHFH